MAVLQGADPGFSLVHGADDWVRASFDGCALVDGSVRLGWQDLPDSDAENPLDAPVRGAGLAFDGHCRLYRSLPDANRIERLHWAVQDPLDPRGPGPEPVPLFTAPCGPLGDFASAAPPPSVEAPRGLAVDADDRLFIALNGTHEVLVVDLWTGEAVRRIALSGQPLDLVADPTSGGRDILAVAESPPGLYRLTARGTPQVESLPDGVAMPARIAVAPDGGRWLLAAAATANARLLALDPPEREDKVPWATDLAFYTPAREGHGAAPVLVVARRPGETFLCRHAGEAGLEKLPQLAARGYDGLGIVATPDGRIAFHTARGLRYAVHNRSRCGRGGKVVGFRLDSGAFQTAWGRLFLDACVPRDTSVGVHCIVTDDPPEGPTCTRRPPTNLAHPSIPHDELSPPLPAAALVDALLDAGTPPAPVHRRTEGSELPWLARDPADAFATYETPIGATLGPYSPGAQARGRYLWVILVLTGNGRATPRVRALRAEHPGHDLVERLPRVLSQEPEAAGFLGRFLAPLAGLLADLDARARLRHALLDPRSAPEDALAWLAGLLGMVLDERWPVRVRRHVIAEAMALFRSRGTLAGLERFVQIVAGVKPVILEHWRMRGGAVIGEPRAQSSRSVLGGGLRVGGQVGTAAETPLGGASVADAFDTHAHRFTVLLPAQVSEDTLELAARVLELHRPAHTVCQLCTAGAGSRVGRGLHLGLSSVVGRGSGWEPIQLGAAVVGRGGILGSGGPPPECEPPAVGAPLGCGMRVC
jgi:phage tail-like protein